MTSQEFREMEEALREIEELVKLFPKSIVDEDDPASEAARNFAETYGHTLLEIARDHLKY